MLSPVSYDCQSFGAVSNQGYHSGRLLSCLHWVLLTVRQDPEDAILCSMDPEGVLYGIFS
jgi:hypothetical protein